MGILARVARAVASSKGLKQLMRVFLNGTSCQEWILGGSGGWKKQSGDNDFCVQVKGEQFEGALMLPEPLFQVLRGVDHFRECAVRPELLLTPS
ncbi:hypothetical protein D3C77_242100 [compost metagenome]